MLLPFTTNEWNAVRFVALTLVCVPVIEKALHRLHQLRAAHRMLNSKPVRIRRSKLGNWGLHQEVDELNFMSKMSLTVVAVLYVGLSLYTEYASGSERVAVTRKWVAPVSTNVSIQGKRTFYDTYMIPAGTYSGCASRESRIEMHHLYENMVVPRILGRFSVELSSAFRTSEFGYVKDESSDIQVPIFDNGTHLIFAMDDRAHERFGAPNRSFISASIDDEAICFSRYQKGRCISTSENISVAAVIGNLVHISNAPNLLLSNNAFEVEDSEYGALVARATTRTQFLQGRMNTRYLRIIMRFKYALSAVGEICLKKPQLQFHLLRVRQNATIEMVPKISFDRAVFLDLLHHEAFFGMFQKKLMFFHEFRNSSMICYMIAVDEDFCAKKHASGAISLHILSVLRESISPGLPFSDWKITLKSQDAKLVDLARGALALLMMSRVVFGRRRPSLEGEIILNQLKVGLPKLQKIGMPGSEYSEIIREEERASMLTWVLLLWVALFFLGLCWLSFTILNKPGLLPDVDFLYRRAVMQQHSAYNCGEWIRNPPTARIRKTGELSKLSISYEDSEDETDESKIGPGNQMI